jgi:hypothetical protein
MITYALLAFALAAVGGLALASRVLREAGTWSHAALYAGSLPLPGYGDSPMLITISTVVAMAW